MNPIERDIMKGLISILNEALDKQHNDKVNIITKEQFNARLEDLKQLEKEVGVVYVNSPTVNIKPKILNNLKEKTHLHPVFSFKECKNVDEVIKFGNNQELITCVKLAGITLSLTYKDGNLISAVTKGNGYAGFDMIEHIKQFQNVPLKINKQGTYIVNGEAIITNEEFTTTNENSKYKNSRELVSEILASLDTSLVAKKKLNFIVCDIVEGYHNTLFDSLHDAEEIGFDVIPYWVLNSLNAKNFENHINYISDYVEEEGLPYEGVIFKFNDIEYGKSLGTTNHHFKNGVIYKINKD